MKPLAFLSAIVALLWVSSSSRAAELGKLRVLYVGEPAGSPRSKQFLGFLQQHVARAEAVNRRGFQVTEAADFDVVLLDWPQSGTSDQERKQPSPLGDRASWSKPTVLLGSAGLNLAIVWKVRGGSG